MRALGAGRALLKLQANHMLTGALSFSDHQLFLPSANVRGGSSVHRSLAAMTTNSDSAGYDARIEAIFEKKRTLRTQIRKALRGMSSSQRANEDDAIQSIVLEAPWFKSSRRVCAYVNCDALREVDTSRILSDIMSDRERLYLPRIEDRNSNMTILGVSSYNDLVSNSMNILEPSPLDLDGNQREDAMQANEPVDLFILPGLAFDRVGRRLGRSGGYYDVYLKKYRQLAMESRWKQPLLVSVVGLSVALAYSVQVVDDGAIGMTSDDVPVDTFVSPSGVIYTSHA